jgi:pilus assembly protein CpaE
MLSKTSNLFASVEGRPPMLGRLFKRGHKARDTSARPTKPRDKNERQDQSPSTTGGVEQPLVSAPIVAVLGAKGGVGASTIAVNLAAAAASSGLSTTLVDGNFQLPDITNLVGREASHSLLELTTRGQDVDRVLYNACRMEILADSPALGVLLPPSDGEAFTKSNLTELVDCLERVRHFSGLFIVDVPSHLDRHLVTLLDQCARIVLVFEATISGVAACRRWLQIFSELGYESDRVMLVVNRAGSRYKIVEEQLGTCFGDLQSWKIPNATNLTWDSSNHGIPIVLSHAGSPYSRAIKKLSGDLNKTLIKR